MKRIWIGLPLVLLSCYLVWGTSNSIQSRRQHDAFVEMKEVDLGALQTSDAANRMQALRALVGIIGPGTRYGVRWKTQKSGRWIDYELIVGSVSGPNELLYCEESDKSLQCFAFYNLKNGTLSEIAKMPSTVDPLKELEKRGYKKQRI